MLPKVSLKIGLHAWQSKKKHKTHRTNLVSNSISSSVDLPYVHLKGNEPIPQVLSVRPSPFGYSWLNHGWTPGPGEACGLCMRGHLKDELIPSRLTLGNAPGTGRDRCSLQWQQDWKDRDSEKPGGWRGELQRNYYEETGVLKEKERKDRGGRKKPEKEI